VKNVRHYASTDMEFWPILFGLTEVTTDRN